MTPPPRWCYLTALISLICVVTSFHFIYQPFRMSEINRNKEWAYKEDMIKKYQEIRDRDLAYRIKTVKRLKERLRESELKITKLEKQLQMINIKNASDENILQEYVFDEVDRMLEKMQSANIAFNVPSEINIKDKPKINLILSLTEDLESLKADLYEGGERFGEEIKVSSLVEAQLTGENFTILAFSKERQAISAEERTEWKWQIIPQDYGTQELHLSLTAIIKLRGDEHPRGIGVYDKTIFIRVTSGQLVWIFIKENWQWLWTVIVGPLLLLLWGYRRRQNA